MTPDAWAAAWGKSWGSAWGAVAAVVSLGGRGRRQIAADTAVQAVVAGMRWMAHGVMPVVLAPEVATVPALAPEITAGLAWKARATFPRGLVLARTAAPAQLQRSPQLRLVRSIDVIRS